MPGFEQIDSSLFKDIHLTERHVVNFRVDGFNVFNFASYGNPNNNVTDNNFGQITSTRQTGAFTPDARFVQFALKYQF